MSLIGKRIKELRKSSKLTQEELAEGIITRGYLSQIEKGTIQPSYEVLDSLANKLGCTVDNLYETPNKNMVLAQYKKDIKSAENHVLNKRFSSALKLIKNIPSTNQLNEYDTGIMNWLYGEYEKSEGNYQEAIDYYQKSIILLKSIKSFNDLVRTMESLATVLMNDEKNEEALKLLNEANNIIIHEQIHGIIKISILINLGIIHGKLNEYYSAINFLEEANELNKLLDTHYKSGHIQMALGICNMELKRTGEARKAFLTASEIFALTKDKDNEAGNYTNLGILSCNEGKYTQSINYLNKAIEIYKQLSVPVKKIINAQLELGKTLYLMGEHEKCIDLCLEILNSPFDTLQIKAYEILGDTYLEKRQHQQAISYYLNALNFCVENSLPDPKCENLYSKLGRSHYEIGDFKEAASFYNKSKCYCGN